MMAIRLPGEPKSGLGGRGALNSLIWIALRSAQVRRISWVRRVRPARGWCEWPPHDSAPGRPPWRRRLWRFVALQTWMPGTWAGHDETEIQFRDLYLILDSRNSTCFFATGSYFFFTSLSVMVREFFRVT